jgi:hypothetical protein
MGVIGGLNAARKALASKQKSGRQRPEIFNREWTRMNANGYFPMVILSEAKNPIGSRTLARSGFFASLRMAKPILSAILRMNSRPFAIKFS